MQQNCLNLSVHDPGALRDETAPAPVRVHLAPPLAVVVGFAGEITRHTVLLQSNIIAYIPVIYITIIHLWFCLFICLVCKLQTSSNQSLTKKRENKFSVRTPKKKVL